ncbi:hypothetical protein N431DRAFT_478102 [Stipitochalara longipes BDJ]|nr:hypothetical protein N431DRAFT_478102 [Stipitochalara longipes BDJ]
MPIGQKQATRKRGRRDEQLPTPKSMKKQRALSPLRNSDNEDASRTKDKIIAALRQDLTQAKSEAREAAMLKQQRDFVVHIAASLNNLQGELLEAWHGDIQKLADTKGFRRAMSTLNELEDRAVAIEETLKDFPGIEESLRANIGALEVDSIKGQVEDFKVVMTEAEDEFTDEYVSE